MNREADQGLSRTAEAVTHAYAAPGPIPRTTKYFTGAEPKGRAN